MNKKLSIKISTISFLLMLFVVLAHATNIDYDDANKDLVWFIQHLILDKLSNVIVPTFFFISGYLFFLSFKENKSVKLIDFMKKIGKRLKTLGVPYLFWCAFWFLFIYVIQLIPQFQNNFSLPLHKMSLLDQFYNLFLEPINYPFWFLRELILYVLVSPVLYLIIKYLKLYSLIVLFILALFSTSFLTIYNVAIFKYLMLSFFILGGYFAINSIKLAINLKWKMVIFMTFSWVVLAAGLLYIEVFLVNKSWITKLFTNLLILHGCISCWLLYDVLDKKYNFQYKKVYAYGFFIYATHGILILLLKKFILMKLHLNATGLLALYIFSFVFISILCIWVGYIFRKTAPKFYFLTTGDR